MTSTGESAAATLPASVLWDAAPDALVLVDGRGVIADANLAAEHLFGHPLAALVGMSVEQLVPEDLREHHVGLRTGFAQAPTRRPMGQGRRLEARRADGSVVGVHVSLAPVTTAAGEAVTLAAIRDLTDFLAAEERAAQANRRRVIAEDHDRIARELHDTVIQELFAMGMGLEAVSPEIPDGPVADRIGRSIDTIDRIITEIRTAIFGLQHGPADDHALHDQVLSVAESVAPSLGFDPKICVEGPLEDLPAAVAEHLVPTVREALTNVARHAEASSATVSVIVTRRRVRVEVNDDGDGFDQPPQRRSGLGNIARRAALLGGESSITCGEGGTTLTWSVPLTDSA